MKKAKKIKYAFMSIVILLIIGSAILLTSGPSKRFVMAVRQMTTLSHNIRLYYQNRPGYWGLNSDMVVKNKIAPKEMIVENKLVSEFGDVIIGEGIDGNIIMPGIKTFDVVYKGLNRIDCINIVGFKFNDEQYLGLLGIKVVSSEQETYFSWGSEYNIPVSKKQATEACGKENTIIWTFE